ncbi:TPA: 7-cyano-7-deazaguanine synthase [Vibrio fluvialis]
MSIYPYILLSGGADSVASLNILHNADPVNTAKLTAIHYDMDDTPRSEPESAIIYQLAGKFPNIQFLVSKLRGFGRGDVLALLMAFVDNIALNHLPEDEVILYMGFESEEVDAYGPNLKEARAALDLLLQARRAYWENEQHPTIRLESVVVGMTKEQIVRRCEDSQFWSCRNPQLYNGHVWRGCGHCHSCQQLAERQQVQPDVNCHSGPKLISVYQA